MMERGYSLKKLDRAIHSKREQSIVTFLYGKNGQKLLDVYIYNVNSQSLGIQVVSKQKINELRIQKADLRNNF